MNSVNPHMSPTDPVNVRLRFLFWSELVGIIKRNKKFFCWNPNMKPSIIFLSCKLQTIVVSCLGLWLTQMMLKYGKLDSEVEETKYQIS